MSVSNLWHNTFFILWLTKIYTLDLKIATKCSVAVYGLSWLYSVFILKKRTNEFVVCISKHCNTPIPKLVAAVNWKKILLFSAAFACCQRPRSATTTCCSRVYTSPSPPSSSWTMPSRCCSWSSTLTCTTKAWLQGWSSCSTCRESRWDTSPE